MTLTAAKAFGATKIVVTDVNSHNLALAVKMGATKTYLPSKTASPQQIADKLQEMLVPVGPQIVLDCVGVESTVQTAVLSCCERGRVVIVGMAQEYVSVPMNMLAAREVEMVGTQRYANTVSIILALQQHIHMHLSKLNFFDDLCFRFFNLPVRKIKKKRTRMEHC